VIRIMTVCGMGLGSSLLASMTAERALKAAGYSTSQFRIDTSDLGSARQGDVDLYLTTNEFRTDIESWGRPVVVVTNVFDEKEMSEQLVPVFERTVADSQ